jgi:prolyl-tRNA synthetase
MRTRLFLRTSEFLWQEGHTAHSSEAEAMAETLQMLEVYREVSEEVLAIPVFKGRKSAGERFPGAVETYTIEGLMRDRKALQCGTSHFLGQNFARAYDVTFLNRQGEHEHAWATSWGFSARMVGATVMTHGDDRGLRLPPAVAPVQVAIVPIYKTDDERGRVLEVAEKIRAALAGEHGVRVRLDDRDQYRPGYKFSEWELKGVPVRIEIGPRDVASDQVVCVDRVEATKRQLSTYEAIESMGAMLDAVQRGLYDEARTFRDANTHRISTFEEFAEGVAAHGGFWTGPWCGTQECEQLIAEKTKATIRYLPIEQEDPGAACMHCGRPGAEVATWARAY